ncbi:MAG: M23 family metallopeptidase [Erysipelotrichaceae bacterium]
MQSNKNFKVLIFLLVSGLLGFMILFIPIIAAAGIVGVPEKAVNEIMNAVGEFVFGDNENTAKNIIDDYIETPECQKVIREKYKKVIDAQQDKEIKIYWLIIPNILAGIESKDITEDMITKQIKLIVDNKHDLTKYMDALRKDEPYKTRYGKVSTTTLIEYINQYFELPNEPSLPIDHLGEHEFLYPLKTKAIITSDYGLRLDPTKPIGSNLVWHSGVDLAFSGGNEYNCGQPIYAAMDGEVVDNETTKSQAGANWGSIKNANIEVWYLHLQNPFPYPVGTKIAKGQFIGYIGNTGISTGCHLHFEIHENGIVTSPHDYLKF